MLDISHADVLRSSIYYCTEMLYRPHSTKMDYIYIELYLIESSYIMERRIDCQQGQIVLHTDQPSNEKHEMIRLLRQSNYSWK